MELDLSHNKIEKISSGIFENLPNLLTLDISYNLLAVPPRNLEQLHKLSVLRLTGNYIQTLPRWLFFMRSLAIIEFEWGAAKLLLDRLAAEESKSAVRVSRSDAPFLSTISQGTDVQDLKDEDLIIDIISVRKCFERNQQLKEMDVTIYLHATRKITNNCRRSGFSIR